MIRFLAALIATAVLVIAVTINLLVKPLNAKDTIGPMIVCEPKAMTDELEKMRAERITKT